ncbi:MAG: GatB/YqeY domain-containing protein [Woeseia sp.]
MTLKAQIQNDMKDAMKAGDKDRLKVVRLLRAAINQVEIDKRIQLDDAAVLAIVGKMVKQRRDSVTQFREGGRPDLADTELAEIKVLQRYLPEPLSDAALEAAIERAIAETGAAGVRDMGKVMSQLKTTVEGRADMGTVGARVKARLAQA